MTKSPTQLFDFTFIDNQADKTLFLLHGTGGSQEDFLFFDKLLHHEFNIVSLQGNEDEKGMARFFKRISEGVFDQENIKQESEKLQEFITNWVEEHEVSIDDMYFLGYSNGANMLLATVFVNLEVIKKLILLHPMLPFEVKSKKLDLSKHQALVTIGLSDKMITHQQSLKVVETLDALGATVTTKEYESGHEITKDEIRDILEFCKSI